jgi:RNA polymerase sigma-70 factor (ECF subfamily)
LAALRRRGRVRPGISEDLAETVADAAVAEVNVWEDERRALADCMQRLPEDGRRLLDLRYATERSVEDIAAQVGRSVDGVKSLLKRMRQTLGQCIDRQLGRSHMKSEP